MIQWPELGTMPLVTSLATKRKSSAIAETAPSASVQAWIGVVIRLQSVKLVKSRTAWGIDQIEASAKIQPGYSIEVFDIVVVADRGSAAARTSHA